MYVSYDGMEMVLQEEEDEEVVVFVVVRVLGVCLEDRSDQVRRGKVNVSMRC